MIQSVTIEYKFEQSLKKFLILLCNIKRRFDSKRSIDQKIRLHQTTSDSTKGYLVEHLMDIPHHKQLTLSLHYKNDGTPFVSKLTNDNEIAILTFLNQKNFQHCPKLFNFEKISEHPPTHLMNIEFINGFTLEKFFQNNNNIQIIEFVFQKIHSVVKELHHIGVVHFDLSIENILITTNYRIYLIDFEISAKTNFSFDKEQDKYDLTELRKKINKFYLK